MDTQFTKSPETDASALNSVDIHQTLGESNLKKSSDLDDILADVTQEDDNSDSALLLDNEPKEEEEKDERDTSFFSPVRTLGPPHCAEPWRDSGRESTFMESSHLSDGVDDKSLALSIGGTENKRSVLFSSLGSEDSTPSLVGAGLMNLGNTCFLNAVLQCFTHTIPLVQSLKSCYHSSSCDCNGEGFCALRVLRDHIELSVASTGRVVSPWTFVNNLSYFSSSFRRFQQEDAHEFLQCFLNRLDSCCNVSNMKDTTQNDDFVKQVFGGRLVSKLQCCNCDHRSDTYEPSIDLSLEIEDAGSLSHALDSFTKIEKIDDPEMKFTCEKCKEQVSVEKQLRLDEAPSVAAFHLKRFKSDGSVVEKIDKHVDFPLEVDLLPYTSGSQNNNVELKYNLYAIVVHIGSSPTLGHYYCFIRSAPDTWYKFDDQKVFQVREDYVLAQEAYILFYVKRGTSWFSSYMEAQKRSMEPSKSITSPNSVLDNVDRNCASSPTPENNHSCDLNEWSDTAGIICTESSTRSGHDRFGVGEVGDDSHRKNIAVPLGESMSSVETPWKVENVISQSALKENTCNKESEIRSIASISIQTPSRSPSPEIYKDDTPENSFPIPSDYLKLVDKVSCKRQLNKELENSERKQACRLIRSMPSARGSKLLAALKGSYSEGSHNKKSRRIAISPSNTRRKPEFRPAMRPLAAGSLR